MVRKRTASELDLQSNASQRFARRATTTNHHSYTEMGPNSNPNMNPNLLSNASSSLLPSPNSSLTSGGSGFSTSNFGFMDSQAGTHLVAPPAAAVAHGVCGFSGLPLFASEREREAEVAVVGADDGGATAWIDGIIRDLISSATDVSISQLVQNVREIIHPCNPSLAALIEFRLRSLTAAANELSSEERRKEMVDLQRQQQQQQQHQQQMSQSSSGLKLYLDSGVENSFPMPITPALNSVNRYLNWVEGTPDENRHLHRQTSAPTTAATPTLSLTRQNQQQQQQQQKLKQQEQPQLQNPPPQQQQQQQVIRDRKEEMRQQKRDEDGLHLLTLLLQCAEAVSADNFEEANQMLLEIAELSTPFGTAAQRVAAYFSEAMTARLVSSCLGIYAPLPPAPFYSQKIVSAFQVFNGISPFVKFSHFTANQAIQEAFEREERVHIIDLDIMQGLQWPGLFHILASRPGGPPYVRLTGLGTSMEALEATGKRLSDFAETLGLPFEFFPVAEKVGNLDPERLNVSKREAVAVHWLHHSLYDVTGSDSNTLWLLQR
ncbi:hypothetical protein MRB53_000885 [Persea americana]|uniref:Uncharacterized protein n=1 Tax=Persea americana TaxID=3435 RepID=A0ACC2MQ24_PERAE|nr:hypothetical protein MRB53_000885 [Persea americana]